MSFMHVVIAVWKTRPQTVGQFWLNILCLYLYENTVVFCYIAAPPNIDLKRRNWRENSGFLLAEIRLGFSPLSHSFLVSGTEGCRLSSSFGLLQF